MTLAFSVRTQIQNIYGLNEHLDEELKKIYVWMKRNKFSVNIEKTNETLFLNQIGRQLLLTFSLLWQ
jgi:hypothetical protein